MNYAELRIFLDGVQADENQLDLFALVKVDQAIGMATEAELEVPVGADSQGAWGGIGEDYAQPFFRIRIEVKIGEGDFTPLIEGQVVAIRYQLSANPNESKMVIVVQDDSLLLNREETVERFENKRPDEIAAQFFSDYGLESDLDNISLPAGGLARETVQRGTAMHLLRDLGRRHGCFVYVYPGADVGKSVGVFKKPELEKSSFPELLLLGSERNLDALEINFDALLPTTAKAASVSVPKLKVADLATASSSQVALGDADSHSLVEAGTILLSQVLEEAEDVDASLQSAVDYSSWALTANGEVSAASYVGVLQTHKTVTVVGASSSLSGNYLISRVTHTISDEGYKQSFQLRRNAQSVPSDGGLGGGIF